MPRANFSYPAPAGTVTVATSSWLTGRATDTPDLADLLDAAQAGDYPPHLARPFTPAPPARAGSARRHGTITCWNPGTAFGFILSDGLTWYAHASQTPRHAGLPPGTQVTFSGHPDPAPGKTYPGARTILPQPPGTLVPPGTAADPAPGSVAPTRPEPAPRGGRESFTAVDSTVLTTVRKARGFSQGDLARQSGLSRTTIIRLERDPGPACHARTAARLAAALGLPPGTLTRPPAAATATARPPAARL